MTHPNFIRLKFYQNSHIVFFWGFFLFFILQTIFWYNTENIKPDVYVIPPVPNQRSIEAQSLGDKQFYFRILATRIENAGDTFGRFTALKNYDYSELYKWLKILDTLDNKSVLVPTLAATYYAQTQNSKDTIHIINYLDEFASRDIDKYWWWTYQAMFIANYNLKDHRLALDLAYKLGNNKAKNAPIWTKQMAAFLHADLGEDCEAFILINKMLKDNESQEKEISQEEMDFMQHFIKDRLGRLEKNNFNPKLCY